MCSVVIFSLLFGGGALFESVDSYQNGMESSISSKPLEAAGGMAWRAGCAGT